MPSVQFNMIGFVPAFSTPPTLESQKAIFPFLDQGDDE